MCGIFVETYDCVNSDISIGVDVYDVELGFVLVGEGYYHTPFSTLVLKDLTKDRVVNIECSESSILSILNDYYGGSIDHIL